MTKESYELLHNILTARINDAWKQVDNSTSDYATCYHEGRASAYTSARDMLEYAFRNDFGNLDQFNYLPLDNN